MTLTYRAVALALLGLVPVALWPHGNTVRWWWVVILVLVGLDVLLACSPRSLTSCARNRTRSAWASRPRPGPGHQQRRASVRGAIRDAWPPSAGAADRHTLAVAAGERTRVTTTLTPTRRGDRPRTGSPCAPSGRSVWPPGSARSRCRGGCGRSTRSRPASTCRAGSPCCGSSTAGPRVRTRGQGTEFDSLREYVDGDDVREHRLARHGPAPAPGRPHLAARAAPPRRHRRRHLANLAGRVDDAPRLDAAMDAALLLTALAGHARDRVQVLAGDRVVRARVGGTDRAKLLARHHQRLAPVESRLRRGRLGAAGHRDQPAGHPASPRRAAHPAGASAIEEGLLPVLPALSAHHRVVVASVADPAVARMRGAARRPCRRL